MKIDGNMKTIRCYNYDELYYDYSYRSAKKYILNIFSLQRNIEEKLQKVIVLQIIFKSDGEYGNICSLMHIRKHFFLFGTMTDDIRSAPSISSFENGFPSIVQNFSGVSVGDEPCYVHGYMSLGSLLMVEAP